MDILTARPSMQQFRQLRQLLKDSGISHADLRQLAKRPPSHHKLVIYVNRLNNVVGAISVTQEVTAYGRVPAYSVAALKSVKLPLPS